MPAYITPKCNRCDVPFEITWTNHPVLGAAVTARCATCGAIGSSDVTPSLAARAESLGPTSADLLAAVTAVLDACSHAHVSKR